MVIKFGQGEIRVLPAVCLAILYVAISCVGVARGQCELQKLLPCGGAAEDRFGASVAVYGNTAIIGAPNHDGEKSFGIGAAYVYRLVGSSWLEEQKLMPSDGDSSDYFGFAVDMDGDVAIINSHSGVPGAWWSGSAYVFRRVDGLWQEEQKLLASDSVPGDHFGTSVAISGDVAIVGATYDEDNGYHSGAAYVFRFDGASWLETQKLHPSDGDCYDTFGEAVAIGGNLAVVGAPAYETEIRPGAAYVFGFDGSSWVETLRISASDGVDENHFGCTLALDGDVLLTGADWDWENGYQAGAGYVFRYNGAYWVEEQKLLASDGNVHELLGGSVAVNGDYALIGAPGCPLNTESSARAYRFDGFAWEEIEKLVPADVADLDRFGFAVGMQPGAAIIGALRDDDNGKDSGSGYVFAIGGPDCNENDIADACDILYGTSEDINNNGIPDECECWADINIDGTVDIDDLFSVLAAWGTCDDCPEDINDDGVVDIDDLFEVLAAWGPCE